MRRWVPALVAVRVPRDDTLETIGRPRLRQRFVHLDCQDLTVDSAKVCATIQTVVYDRGMTNVFYRS